MDEGGGRQAEAARQRETDRLAVAQTKKQAGRFSHAGRRGRQASRLRHTG
jgi:hypothetical protein